MLEAKEYKYGRSRVIQLLATENRLVNVVFESTEVNTVVASKLSMVDDKRLFRTKFFHAACVGIELVEIITERKSVMPPPCDFYYIRVCVCVRPITDE